MKIYCVQMNIDWENKEVNFARVEALLRATPPERDSLVLLPEMFATGFTMNATGVREPAKGPTENFLAGLARRHGIFVTGGLVGMAGSDRGQNLAVVFDPNGAEVARYNKMQPFSPGGEADHYEAGSKVVTWNWGGLQVAPFVCYDLRFPEHFRRAARSRVELITVIANWPVGRIQHWVTLLQARAIENQAFVAGVNRCGEDPKLTYTGRSLIVSPKGDILADAGPGEGVISAELDVKGLKTYRADFPFLNDMRED